MSSIIKTIVFNIGSFILGVLIGYLIYCSINKSRESISQIDSLNNKVDSINIVNDSIKERIDTIYIKLGENNQKYEENFNRIINNDTNEDYKFFLKYISNNKQRFNISINN